MAPTATAESTLENNHLLVCSKPGHLEKGRKIGVQRRRCMPFTERNSIGHIVRYMAMAEQLQHGIFTLQCHCAIAMLKLADR